MKISKITIITLIICIGVFLVATFFLLGNKDYAPEREEYLLKNISSIAAQNGVSEVLGGTFFVTNIYWKDRDIALIEFEDGHNLFMAEISFKGDEISSFILK